MKLHRSSFYTIFIVALLTTEFQHINIWGGAARIYHFWAGIIAIISFHAISNLFRSRAFTALLCFATVNLIASLLSDEPGAALASLLSSYANLVIAAVVTLALLRRRLSLEQLANIILTTTAISVIWGLIQIIAFKAGTILALSPEQEGQIRSRIRAWLSN